MTFSWSQFVEIAEYLKEQGEKKTIPLEAAYRCSISRAYYGAFRYARDYATAKMGFTPKQSSKDHSDLRNVFRKNNMMSIYRKLDSLRQWRNACDYDNPFKGTNFDLATNVSDSITTAHEIIAALR